MTYKPSVRLEIAEERFRNWSNITLKRSLDGLSMLSIDFANPAGLHTLRSYEDMPLKLWLGWDTADPPLVFDGYLDKPTWDVTKTDMSMSLSGRDFGRVLFDELTVDVSFNSFGNPIGNGYVIEYLKYIADNLSTPISALFTRNLDVDNDDGFTYDFGYKKCIEAINDLKKYGKYEWFMTSLAGVRHWIVRPPKSLSYDNVTRNFVVGEKNRYSDLPAAPTQQIERVSVEKEFGFKKNYVKVFGSEDISAIFPLSPPSTPKHLIVEDEGIIDEHTAKMVAQRMFFDKSVPKTHVDFSTIGVENLNVGDVIYVNDLRYGVSTLPTKLFRIIEINDIISSSGWKSTFSASDYMLSIHEFINKKSYL